MVRRLALLTVLLLGVFVQSAAASAQPAALVKDLRAGSLTSILPSAGLWSAQLSGVTYFPVDDGAHGYELWRSDGTEAGTDLFEDVCPGTCNGLWNGQVVASGGKLFFAGDDGAHGLELWTSDGTIGGTHMVTDAVQGLTGSRPLWLTDVAGILYFSLTDAAGFPALWKSDGTAGGTAEVLAFPASTAVPSRLVALGSKLFFVASDGVHGFEPWISDGTPGGTQMLLDVNPGASDGAYGGYSPYPSPFFASVAAGGRVYFEANEPSTGFELWSTDGTPAGTALVVDADPGAGDGSPREVHPFGSGVVFTAFTGASSALFVSDGTAAGTSVLTLTGPSGPGSGPLRLQPVGSRIFFTATTAAEGLELWVSDGTSIGTHLVRDIVPGSASAFQFPGVIDWGALGTRFFAWVWDGAAGAPWVSDGTVAGTIQIADPPVGQQISGSYYSVPFPLGSSFGFMVSRYASESDFREQLWATDGTAAGTHLVRDVSGETSSLRNYFGRYFMRLEGGASRLAFLPNLGATTDVWVSDGTGPGTVAIASTSDSGVVKQIANRTYFDHQDAVLGSGLWVYDGVSSQFLAAAEAAEWASAGGVDYFTGSTGLWRTDGTPGGTLPLDSAGAVSPVATSHGVVYAVSCALKGNSGTVPSTTVLQSFPGSGYCIAQLATDGSTAFFAHDASSLWQTDGTAGGTHLVKDLSPAAIQGLVEQGQPGVPGIRVVSGIAYFVADDPVNGPELWTSDGTAPGTHLVKDIYPGTTGASPQWLTAAGDGIFFTADDGVHGRELWWSDGTDPGTHMVKDIVPGAGSGLPQELAFVDSVLLFSAHDATAGREMWASNGSEAGTVRIQDIDPGPEPSSPMSFTGAGSNVFFYANDGVHGFELWALPRAALADAVSAALDFYTVPPCRVLDTRTEGGAIVGGTERVLDVAGRCGIPSSARAVAVNVTAVDPTAMGFLALGAGNQGIPGTSVVNFAMGKARAASTVLRLATDGSGKAKVKAALNGGGTVQVVLDVAGWFE